MTITVSVPDQVADRAAEQGVSVEGLMEQLAQQAKLLKTARAA